MSFLACFSAFFRSRCNLSLEILDLLQQLGVLERKQPRPRLRMQDRIFWILLDRLWPAWRDVLVIVKPETVAGWHRAGFRLFWCLRSRPRRLGRPKIDAELRALIQRMVEETATWGVRLSTTSRSNPDGAAATACGYQTTATAFRIGTQRSAVTGLTFEGLRRVARVPHRGQAGNGRPGAAKEIPDWVWKVANANGSWGSARLHGVFSNSASRVLIGRWPD
jgi:hypothetical protein